MNVEPHQSISFCRCRILGTNTVRKASRKKEYTVKGSRIRIALDFSVAALETEENGAMLSEFSGEMT